VSGDKYGGGGGYISHVTYDTTSYQLVNLEVRYSTSTVLVQHSAGKLRCGGGSDSGDIFGSQSSFLHPEFFLCSLFPPKEHCTLPYLVKPTRQSYPILKHPKKKRGMHICPILEPEVIVSQVPVIISYILLHFL